MIKLDLYKDDFYNHEMWDEVCDSLDIDSDTTEYIVLTVDKAEVGNDD